MNLLLGWAANYWWVIAAVLVAIAVWANPVLVWKLKAWILLAVVLWWGWTGHAALHAEQLAHRETKIHQAEVLAGIAEQTRKAAVLARAAEQDHAKALGAIGDAYEKGKQDAQAGASRDLDALRAGNLRLRSMWQGCEADATARVPGTAAGTGERDDATERRFQGASDLVRIADESDEQLAACQAVVREDRK